MKPEESPRQANNFHLGRGQLSEPPRATSARDYRLTLRLPFYRAWEPGQFVMVRWGRRLVGRPFAIVDWRPAADGSSLMSVWVRRLGSGTEELFRDGRAGTEVSVTAPLGRGFAAALVRAPRVLLLSGGVGGASVLPLHALRQGRDLWIHGEREPAFLDRELAASLLRPQRIYVETQAGDGLAAGRITDGLQALSDAEKQGFAHIVACGPSAMLEAVAREVAAIPGLDRLPLHLGLEERMGCGIGLCFSCSVWTTDGMKRLCTEGPWFEAARIPDHFACRKGEVSKGEVAK